MTRILVLLALTMVARASFAQSVALLAAANLPAGMRNVPVSVYGYTLAPGGNPNAVSNQFANHVYGVVEAGPYTGYTIMWTQQGYSQYAPGQYHGSPGQYLGFYTTSSTAYYPGGQYNLGTNACSTFLDWTGGYTHSSLFYPGWNTLINPGNPNNQISTISNLYDFSNTFGYVASYGLDIYSDPFALSGAIFDPFGSGS